MTAPVDLDQMETVLAAAVSRPWRAKEGRIYGPGYLIARVVGDAPEHHAARDADAAAIVAAVNAAPQMAAELRELRATRDAVRALADEWAAKCPPDGWPSVGGVDSAIIADCGRAVLHILGGS